MIAFFLIFIPIHLGHLFCLFQHTVTLFPRFPFHGTADFLLPPAESADILRVILAGGFGRVKNSAELQRRFCQCSGLIDGNLPLLQLFLQLIDLPALQDGYIAEIHTRNIGYAAKALGAGRERKEDAVDLSVGLVMKKRIGDYVRKGDTLCTLHVGANSKVDQAAELMNSAFVYADSPVKKPQLVHCVVE